MTKKQNIFLRDMDFYVRELDPVTDYIKQTAFYKSVMTGEPIDDCVDKIKARIRDPDSGTKDPTVRYFLRDETQDTNPTETTLTRYIKDIIHNEEVLAPTFTSYLPASQRKSFLVDFILDNVKMRSKAKKAAFKAEAEGNRELYINKNNEQANKKTYNNSISGAFATKGSVLQNPSAHSTLTSTTRSVSSISNASNEKIISGNRHYYSYDVTLNNLISISSSVRSDLTETMTKYNLHYPTTDEVMECISYSTRLYWTDRNSDSKLRLFVSKLSPLQKAGIVYIGDLYHIRKYNDSFVRTFLTRLSSKVTDQTVNEPIAYAVSSDEQIVNLAHIICSDELRGKGKDYDTLSTAEINTLTGTITNIGNVLTDYKDFIKAIFLTRNVPASTAYIRDMVRRTVVLSDTDSTMFSVDEYVNWYFGDYRFSPESTALAGSVMFLATQCIGHVLAVLSANMNVSRDNFNALSMKPEFSFSVFFQSSVSKHYFTSTDVKEGNIFAKPKIEIKGVHLKNSAAPKEITRRAHIRMESFINKIKNNEKISLVEELQYVSNLEQEIKTSLLTGDVTYYKHSKIKLPDSYANEAAKSPYFHHMLWMEVFADKYGSIDPPPYLVIKIPTIINNKTAIKTWLENIEDTELRERLKTYLTRYNKTSLPTMYLSDDYVRAFGIPAELMPIINTKKILLDLTNVSRMTLEALGYYPKAGWTITELLAT